jgi:hypothetical protein
MEMIFFGSALNMAESSKLFHRDPVLSSDRLIFISAQSTSLINGGNPRAVATLHDLT